MVTFRSFVLLCSFLGACASPSGLSRDAITDVYVKDFQSSEPAMCKTSDVPLGHGEALEFFKRSKHIDYKTMVDNYPVAPCHISGTLKLNERTCDWKILAGATGSIACQGEDERYFACDACKDLFAR